MTSLEKERERETHQERPDPAYFLLHFPSHRNLQQRIRVSGSETGGSLYVLSASLIYVHQFRARRPRVRSVVENFNARLSILDHSFSAIRLKRYTVAAINLNRFLLGEREKEIERHFFPNTSPLIFLMFAQSTRIRKKLLIISVEKNFN